jgi:hypothetical protein
MKSLDAGCAQFEQPRISTAAPVVGDTRAPTGAAFAANRLLGSAYSAHRCFDQFYEYTA